MKKNENIIKFDPDFLSKKESDLSVSEDELFNKFLNSIDSDVLNNPDLVKKMSEGLFPPEGDTDDIFRDESIQKLINDPNYSLSPDDYFNVAVFSPQAFLLNILTFRLAFKKQPQDFMGGFCPSQEKISVSMDEAVDYYGRFIIEFDPDQGFDFLDKSHVQSLLWKYFTDLEKAVFSIKSTKKMIKEIRKYLDFNDEKLTNFLVFMFNVKLVFAPSEYQKFKNPYKGSEKIEILKDYHIMLQPFNYFNFDPTLILGIATNADLKLFETLDKIEYYYEEKEYDYFSKFQIEKFISNCQKRLKIHLNKCGIKSISENISKALVHFLRFVYFENKSLTVESVKPAHIKKFFKKINSLNKTMSPYELTFIAPSIFNFYVYLAAHGHCEIPEKIIEAVMDCEIDLLDALREDLDI